MRLALALALAASAVGCSIPDIELADGGVSNDGASPASTCPDGAPAGATCYDSFWCVGQNCCGPCQNLKCGVCCAHVNGGPRCGFSSGGSCQ